MELHFHKTMKYLTGAVLHDLRKRPAFGSKNFAGKKLPTSLTIAGLKFYDKNDRNSTIVLIVEPACVHDLNQNFIRFLFKNYVPKKKLHKYDIVY